MTDERRKELDRLRKDQQDWRKGVALIASALQINTLSCVDLAEAILRLQEGLDAIIDAPPSDEITKLRKVAEAARQVRCEYPPSIRLLEQALRDLDKGTQQ